MQAAIGTAAAQPMLAYADGTVLLPEGISYEPRNHSRMKPSAVVGIGGLGHLALQYAKAAGFRTYAVKAGGADVILSASNSNAATASMIGALRSLSWRKSVIGASQNGRTYLYEALVYVARGKVRIVAENFALMDINTAYDRVRSGNVRFRAIIHPAG